MSKYIKGKSFVDKYGRKYKIVEAIEREGYTLYNIYPKDVSPIPVKYDYYKARGFLYMPYLDIIEEALDDIFVRYIGK